jgi:hypothetical protein
MISQSSILIVIFILKELILYSEAEVFEVSALKNIYFIFTIFAWCTKLMSIFSYITYYEKLSVIHS